MIYSRQEAGEATWEALKTQVARLGQLDGYPKPEFQPEAFRELVIALQNADTLEDAKNFIDDVMMCEMVCPKPSQLRDMIRSAREAKIPNPAFQEIDAWKRLQQFEPEIPASHRENMEAHMTILKARMKETTGMTWPQRQQSTPLKEALQIASKQLLDGERVSGRL
jgi:hypothetical protein